MTKLHPTNAAHQRLHDGFKAAITRAVTDDLLSMEEVLAVASKVVGMLVALQDQRKYTTTEILEVVQRNIEQGNADFIQDMFHGLDVQRPQ